MRDIKFRAWDKKKKEMMGKVWELRFSHSPYYDGENVVAGDRQSDNFELMQYTGLKDKNGVEIYEGDIVKWANETTDYKNIMGGIGFVKFHPEYLRYDVAWGKQKDPSFGTQVLLSDIKKCVEVIGDIYEHSHLLDK